MLYALGSLALIEATASRVRYQLDERIQFTRYSKREKTWVPTRCHSDIAGQVVANATELEFRACAGIVHVPLFVGGEIVSTPGWHLASGLILDVSGLPEIPSRPTQEDAERALNRLLRPFRGFEGNVDRCALAATALTAVLRASLRTAPAILFDGNGPGVGKGLLARTLTVIATGRTPAVITEGHNAEETEKRIAAALLSAVPVILLDNLQRHVASSALESALTEGTANIRTFGTLTSYSLVQNTSRSARQHRPGAAND